MKIISFNLIEGDNLDLLTILMPQLPNFIEMKRNSLINITVRFTFLLAVFFYQNSFAQITGKVIYQGYWPLTPYRIVEGSGELVFSNYKSIILPIGKYSNHLFVKGSNKNFEEINDPNHFMVSNIQHGDTSKMDYLSIRDPFNLFVDLEKNVLLHKVKNAIADNDIPLDQIILLSEQTGLIRWELHKDIKHIGKYLCQKATTTFRGRDYTVWFAPEIPVSFGPWKLNGLPGLILEASDSSNQVYFYATSILVENKKGLALNTLELLGENIPVYPMKDYHKKLWERDKEIERKGFEIGQRIQAKAPKGVIISFTTSLSKNGLELEYEF